MSNTKIMKLLILIHHGNSVLIQIGKNAFNNLLIYKPIHNRSILTTIPYIFMIYKNIPSTIPRCSLCFLGPVFTGIKGLIREGLLTQPD